MNKAMAIFIGSNSNIAIIRFGIYLSTLSAMYSSNKKVYRASENIMFNEQSKHLQQTYVQDGMV